MINFKLENELDKLEKEFNYSASFYLGLQEWLENNNVFKDQKDLDTLLLELNSILSELYLYKKSLNLVNQVEVEKKVIDVLDSHVEFEVTEPEVTLKF